MRNQIYNYDAFITQFDDGGMGGLFDSIVSIGVGAVGGLFGGGGSSKSGQAKGLKEITAFGNKAISTLNEIGSRLGGGTLTPTQAIFESQRIAATLSDPTFVFQAKNGDDAAALRNFKTQAAQLVAQIKSAADAQTAAQAAAMTGESPAAASLSATGDKILGLDPTTLLLAGGAGLLLIFLTRS